MKKEILRVNSLCKAYNRDRILTDVSFSVFSGEIVSIIGHNGVGKTVLGKILGGELKEDAGAVWFEGSRVFPGKERSSRMYYIPEEGKILENLTVAENLFIGQEKKKNCYLKTASVFQAAGQYLDRYQFQVNPESRGRELSEAKRRMLLLLRQIVSPPKLLIVDGIMDLISAGDLETVRRMLKDLVLGGTAILYLTCDQQTAMELSSRILLMQGGIILYEMGRDEYSEQVFRKAEAGLLNEIHWERMDRRPAAGREVLRVENISTEHLKNISFSLRKGEVLGILGTKGGYPAEILKAIGGYQKPEGGRIYVNGRQTGYKNPRAAVRAGVCFCGDAHEEMLLDENTSVKINMSLRTLSRISRRGLISAKYEKIWTEEYRKTFGISCDLYERLQNLNYSARSKLIIASCMGSHPSVLLLNKVTRGLDEEEVKKILGILNQVRKTAGLILNLSRVEQELQLCSRILIIGREGITGEITGQDAENVTFAAKYEK